MTAIWQNDGEKWKLLAPAGFPNEATLHDLIEGAPHLLPLAGAPQLTVLGREVQLGPNRADLIAVEPSGRLVVVEIKLANNPEARRAIIVQVLTYAAYLRGMDPATLERTVLGGHLQRRGFGSIGEAVTANGQQGSFDNAALADGLATGRFRLVLVLDQAPEELVRLVGYLEAVTDGLLIDLITVSAYQVGGSQVVVPQRVDPERVATPTPVATPSASAISGGQDTDADEFRQGITALPPEVQPGVIRLMDWASALEREGLARLAARRDTTGWHTLRIHIPGEFSLVNIQYGPRSFTAPAWRTVFERRAPQALARLEQMIAPATLGVGKSLAPVDDSVLAVLTDAYREAATGKITPPVETG